MPFLNERRRRAYPRILVGLVLFWGIAGIFYWWPMSASRGDRYGGDFVVYHSAASLAEQGRPSDAFDYDALHEQERTIVPDTELYPWHYPPQFLMVVRPFAELPYWAALVVWTVLGVAALGAVVYFTGARTLGTLGIPLCGGFVNLAFGQNGFLTGALLGGGLGLLGARPFAGGLVLGLLTYKPHFAVTALFALLITRNWRALGGAALSAVTLAALSLLMFGPSTWQAFLDDAVQAADVLYLPGAWEQMPSALAAALLLEAPKPVAQAVQAVWSLGVFAALAWLVLSRAPEKLKYAGIAAATLAASPYVFMYDLAVLAVPVSLLLLPGTGRLPGRWEAAVFGACAIMPVGAWILAEATNVQLGPLVLLALFGVVLARARAELRLRAPALRLPVPARDQISPSGISLVDNP